MKNNLFRAAFLLVVGCCMVACSGSDDVTTTDTPQQPQQPAANQAVQLEGTLGAKAGMTRSIEDDGTGNLQGTWHAGDQFAIYYPTASGNATAIATVSGVNGEGAAEFKATLYGPKIGKNPVKFIYPATAHDGRGGIKKSVLANQEGTLDYISKQLDIETGVGTIDVEDRSPRDPKATLTADITLEPQVCIYQFNLKKADGTTTSDLSATKFVATDGTNTYTVSPAAEKSEFCIAMLPAANADFTFTATTTESAKIYQYQCDLNPKENITTAHLGCVIATDGKVYKYSEVEGIKYSKSFTSKTIESAKFYSQDLTLEAAQPSVTPVAMIAYVGENTAEGTYGYKRGLAVSMYSPGSGKNNINYPGTNVSWSTKTTRRNAYQATSITGPFEAESGLQYRRDASRNNDELPAFKLAASYSVDGFDNSQYGCSEWFIPSAYQWIQMQQNNGGMGNNQKFADAMYNLGGTVLGLYSGASQGVAAAYWTCTEIEDTNSSWVPYIDTVTRYVLLRQSSGGMNNVLKSNEKRPVRPIFAF